MDVIWNFAVERFQALISLITLGSIAGILWKYRSPIWGYVMFFRTLKTRLEKIEAANALNEVAHPCPICRQQMAFEGRQNAFENKVKVENLKYVSHQVPSKTKELLRFRCANPSCSYREAIYFVNKIVR